MRDYKKGKFLLDSKPGQLLPLPSTSGGGSQATSSSAVTDQQKRIFDKVWTAVEKVMEEMRSTMLAQLKDHSRPVDEQEKTIECVIKPCSLNILKYKPCLFSRILLEIGSSEDPVWVYFESQHKHILDSMRVIHYNSVNKISGERVHTEV